MPRIIFLRSLFILIASLISSPAFEAAAVNPTIEFDFGCPAAATGIEVRLVTGPQASGGTTSPCEDGSGDEICGLFLVLKPMAGATLQGFVPADGLTRVDAPTFATTGRIVRLNPAGDIGSVTLGCLSTSGPSGATLVVGNASEAVNARLDGVGVQSIPLPEPTPLFGLAVGALLLIRLAQRRRTFGRARTQLVPCAMLLLSFVVWAPPIAQAQIYLERDGFLNAIGSEDVGVEDFTGLAFNGSGFAAFSNGALFGGGAFSYTSTTLPSDIDLEWPQGTDTGLNGTLLVANATAPETTILQASPGGLTASAFPESDDDDFELEFTTPVDAAGFDLQHNIAAAGEFVEFQDSTGAALKTIALPAGTVFVGYVATPGQPRIKRIVVNEDTGGDDIGFDKVTWKEDVKLAFMASIPRPRLQDWQTFGYPEFPIGASDAFAVSAVGIGDLDDDGVPDLAIGAPADDDGQVNAGAVYIAFMQRNGDVRSLRKISDTLGGLSGFQNPGGLLVVGEEFGQNLAAPGDLDGDGIEDLVVGCGNFQIAEQFYVLFLRKNGTVRSFQRVNASEGGFAGGIANGDRFGYSVASLGDLDGDGVTDLAVGAERTDDGATDAGAVWILFMNANGTVRAEQKIGSTTGGFGAGLLDASDYFGRGLRGIGDLNHDGVRDLAVGAPRDDDTGANTGAVWILFLNTDGTVQSKTKIPTASFNVFFYGISVAVDSAQFGTHLSWIPTPGASTPGVLAVGSPNNQTQWPGFPPGELNVIATGAITLITLDEAGAVVNRSGIARSLPPSWLPELDSAFDPSSTESAGLSVPAFIGDLDDDGSPELFAGAPSATPAGGPNTSGNGFLWTLNGLDSSAYADAVFAGSSTLMLGEPDSVGSSFNGVGTVQFVDNVAFADGTSAPDLVVHRRITDVVFTQDATIQVEASTDGLNFAVVKPSAVYAAELGVFGDDCGVFFLLPCVANSQIFVDLDQGGFGPTDAIRFIRITHTYVGCGPVVCLHPPRIDAIEALNTASTVLDKDFDSIPDGFDNCRSRHNPNQEDADLDGWGDFCDNCPDFGNADQEPICTETTLRLTPSSGHGIGLEWQLDLLCGSSPISLVNVGIIAPPGTDPTTLKFGADPAISLSGCGAPNGSQVRPGVPTGSGCAPMSGSTLLNNTLESSDSGVIGPADYAAPGLRTDTLYLLFGDLFGAELCTGNHEEVSLGFVSVDDPGGTVDAPVFTTQGVDVLTTEQVWAGILLTNGAGDPVISLSMSPSTAGMLDEYEVCVLSDRNLNRITFSMEAPAGFTTNDIRWKGCSTVTGGSQAHRSCNSSVYPNVSAANSRTWGPTASDPTMFIQLEGNIPVGFDLIPAVNADPNELTCLGLIEILGSPFVPTLSANEIGNVAIQPPIRVAEDQAPLDGTPDALALPSCAAPGVTGACVSTASSLNAPDDLDEDGVRDESDNCILVPNADQMNSGGLLSFDPSLDSTGLGDACQCGDLDDSGVMLANEADVDLMVDYLLGIAGSTAPPRCSVSRSGNCDIVDAAILEAGLAGNQVTLTPACPLTLN